ncbi:MAG: hypothetical protein L3K25_12520 [Gammaproteobacteria bacterium]|nr:hypothetical protein [Gammaproteobacteria bacterium]
MEQAQRFHQQAIKEQQIASVLTTTDKKIKTLQQQLKVNVHSGSNLEYIPFPFGGTATLVPPYGFTGYTLVSEISRDSQPITLSTCMRKIAL